MHYIGKHKDLKNRVVTEWTEVSDLLKLYHSSSIGGHSGVNNTRQDLCQLHMEYDQGVCEGICKLKLISNISYTHSYLLN